MTRREFIAVAVGWSVAAAVGAFGGLTDNREPRSGNPKASTKEPP